MQLYQKRIQNLNFKNTYFEEHLQTTVSGTSRGVSELLLKDFIFKWMLINFSVSLLLAVYYGRHHEQCIFIYDSAGKKRNDFQQPSKLIELKFISSSQPH